MNLQSDSAKMLFLCKLVVTPKTINITEASKCCINFCQWPEFDFLMWVLTIDKTVQSSYPSVCVPSCSLLLVWTGSRPESCTKMQQTYHFFPPLSNTPSCRSCSFWTAKHSLVESGAEESMSASEKGVITRWSTHRNDTVKHDTVFLIHFSMIKGAGH